MPAGVQYLSVHAPSAVQVLHPSYQTSQFSKLEILSSGVLFVQPDRIITAINRMIKNVIFFINIKSQESH